MRLRLARKLELRMLKAAARWIGYGSWTEITREDRRAHLEIMLKMARVRRQSHRRAFQRVWKAETR